MDRKAGKNNGTEDFHAGSRIVKAVCRPVRRIIIKAALLAVVLCAAGAGVYFGWKSLTKVRMNRTQALIEQQLTRCQELVTVKNHYSDIVSIKKSSALGMAKSYSIVKYSGIVRAGIRDITMADVSVSADGKKVVVVLPRSEILGNEIASQEVFDEHRNIFVPITTQEIFDGIRESRNKMTQNVTAGGILTDADVQAKAVVQTMLYAAGFQIVVVN